MTFVWFKYFWMEEEIEPQISTSWMSEKTKPDFFPFFVINAYIYPFSFITPLVFLITLLGKKQKVLAFFFFTWSFQQDKWDTFICACHSIPQLLLLKTWLHLLYFQVTNPCSLLAKACGPWLCTENAWVNRVISYLPVVAAESGQKGLDLKALRSWLWQRAKARLREFQ